MIIQIQLSAKLQEYNLNNGTNRIPYLYDFNILRSSRFLTAYYFNNNSTE